MPVARGVSTKPTPPNENLFDDIIDMLREITIFISSKKIRCVTECHGKLWSIKTLVVRGHF